MKKATRFLITSFWVGLVAVPSFASAGNIKKIYINVAKEGQQAQATDIPANYSSIVNAVNTQFTGDAVFGHIGLFHKNSTSEISYEPALYGQSVKLNNTIANSDAYISSPLTELDQQKPSTLTVEIDAKFDSFTDTWQIPIGKEYSGWNAAFELGVYQKHPWFEITTTNTANSSYNASVVLETNKWYHFSWVYDGSNLYGYINGEKAVQFAATGNLRWTEGKPLIIGKVLPGSSSYRFSGNLDEARIWNYPLTQSEIKGYMGKALQGNEKGLVGYWNFN